MTSEGLGEMFEGDSADMCAGKFPLVSMGGRAEGLACADPGVWIPIGASGNSYLISYKLSPSQETSTQHSYYLLTLVRLLTTSLIYESLQLIFISGIISLES